MSRSCRAPGWKYKSSKQNWKSSRLGGCWSIMLAVRADLAKGKNSKQVSRQKWLDSLDSWWFMLNLCWFPTAFIILFLQSEMHIGAELGGQFAIRVGHLSTETVPMSTICLRKLWEVKLSMKALWLRLQVWFMCLQHPTTHIHETGRKAKLRVQSGRGVAMQHQFVHGCCFSLRLLVQAILGTEPWFPRESTWASLAVPSFNLVCGLCGPLFE